MCHVVFVSIAGSFVDQSELMPSLLCLATHSRHCRMLPTHSKFLVVCYAGQPVAVSAPQGAPHEPSSAHAGAVGKSIKPVPAHGAHHGTAQASHVYSTHPQGTERKAAAQEGIQPESHGVHAVQGHSSANVHPRPALQGLSRADLPSTPAGQAAHTLPMAGQPAAGQTTRALPTPANTSALPAAQAQPVSLPMQPPQQGATAVPTLPSGAAPVGRPGQRAEHPGLMPDAQHAQQAARHGAIQDAPPDSWQEAAHKHLTDKGE